VAKHIFAFQVEAKHMFGLEAHSSSSSNTNAGKNGMTRG